MTELELYRKGIDEIDAQLASLFEKRFEIVKDVIGYKIRNQIPVQDTGREALIIEKNKERITDCELRPYFEEWYTHMISLSRDYQNSILEKQK